MAGEHLLSRLDDEWSDLLATTDGEDDKYLVHGLGTFAVKYAGKHRTPGDPDTSLHEASHFVHFGLSRRRFDSDASTLIDNNITGFRTWRRVYRAEVFACAVSRIVARNNFTLANRLESVEYAALGALQSPRLDFFKECPTREWELSDDMFHSDICTAEHRTRARNCAYKVNKWLCLLGGLTPAVVKRQMKWYEQPRLPGVK